MSEPAAEKPGEPPSPSPGSILASPGAAVPASPARTRLSVGAPSFAAPAAEGASSAPNWATRTFDRRRAFSICAYGCGRVCPEYENLRDTILT